MPTLRRDLTSIQDVFLRADVHLSQSRVAEAFVRVFEIVEFMEQPTASLIAAHQSLTDGALVAGYKHLSRNDVFYILTHRADRDASKYLKATTAMPKVQGHSAMTKLKNMGASMVKRVGKQKR